MITLKLPQGPTWKVPYTTLDAHQRDAKETNTMGLTMQNRYRNQTAVSQAKGRLKAIMILTLFFLKNLVGYTLDIT